MSNILTIGFTTEGSTDVRFLGNIIGRTFESAVFECQSEIQVYEPEHITCEQKKFTEKILELAIQYSNFHVICVHCDADAPSSQTVMQNKILPAFQLVEKSKTASCQNLVAVIPVQMTEAWLMADLDLLKKEIGTTLSNDELGLPVKANLIENLRNPKEKIEEALRIAQAQKPRRKRRFSISEIYSPISQKISLIHLEALPSFLAFKANAKEALRQLNYLH